MPTKLQTKGIPLGSIKVGLAPLRIRLGLVLLLLLVVSAYGAMKSIRANLHFNQAKQMLVQWQDSGQIPARAQYEHILGAIQTANDLHPRNPLYLDLQAQVLEWGILGNYASEQVLNQQARDLYLQSSRLRPTWPVTWASLALLKWRAGEFDQEMLAYLQRAAEYGPAQPEVHLLFSDLGLALYAANHPLFIQVREQVKARLGLALAHPNSRNQTLAAIDRHRAQRTVCRWLKSHPPRLTNSLKCEV